MSAYVSSVDSKLARTTTGSTLVGMVCAFDGLGVSGCGLADGLEVDDDDDDDDDDDEDANRREERHSASAILAALMHFSCGVSAPLVTRSPSFSLVYNERSEIWW